MGGLARELHRDVTYAGARWERQVTCSRSARHQGELAGSREILSGTKERLRKHEGKAHRINRGNGSVGPQVEVPAKPLECPAIGKGGCRSVQGRRHIIPVKGTTR